MRSAEAPLPLDSGYSGDQLSSRSFPGSRCRVLKPGLLVWLRAGQEPCPGCGGRSFTMAVKAPPPLGAPGFVRATGVGAAWRSPDVPSGLGLTVPGWRLTALSRALPDSPLAGGSAGLSAGSRCLLVAGHVPRPLCPNSGRFLPLSQPRAPVGSAEASAMTVCSSVSPSARQGHPSKP